MAFLNQSMLQGRPEETAIEAHPLLGQEDIPLHVRKMYVNGCVFAVLMDDEKIDDTELSEMRKLGASLQLDGLTVDECINTVRDMPESDRGEFADEMIETISFGKVGLSFLFDFERLLAFHGGRVADENYQVLNRFGTQITKVDDWRVRVDELDMPNDARITWHYLCDAASHAGDSKAISLRQRQQNAKYEDLKKRCRQIVCSCGSFANAGIARYFGRPKSSKRSKRIADTVSLFVSFSEREWRGYPYALILWPAVLIATLLLGWLFSSWLIGVVCWLGWICIPIVPTIIFIVFAYCDRRGDYGCGIAFFLLASIICLLYRIFF